MTDKRKREKFLTNISNYEKNKVLVFGTYDFRDEKGLGFWCPRCGWHKGKIWHCGLCEGDEKNIIQFLTKLGYENI